MTVVDTDTISVVDDKKSMNIDLSDSLFDYDLLLKDVDDSNGTSKENEEFFQGLFNNEAHDLNSISNLSSSASSSPQQYLAFRRRPNVMQWGPQDGQESCTIVSIVLQHHQETAPMKIVFGTLTVETAQQQHILASSSSSSNGGNGDGQSVWITLAASVPPFKDIRSDSAQVKISVCLFDCNDPDLAVDTWDIGQFTYTEEEQLITGSSSSSNRKRALSCEPEECAQKKHTYDVKAEQGDSEDVDSQLLKLLAPYDPLLTVNNGESMTSGNAPGSVATRTNVWLSPTSSGDSSSNSSLAPQNQSNYYTSVPPTFPLTVNHMMLQQGLLNSKRSQHHQQPVHRSPVDMAQKHDMYRMYSNMQHQQQRHNPYLMHYQNQPNYMSPAMNNYTQHKHNSHYSNSNNSVLYNMSEHQRQTQQYQRIQHQSFSTPYSSTSSSSIAPNAVPRRASAPSTTSYTTTNSNSCALNKAHLKLNGDLMDMVSNWSVPEWQSGRRLVHFWRRTTRGPDGSLALVECGFEPMDQQLYHQQRMRDNVAAVAAAAAAAAAVSNNSPSVNIKSNTVASGARHGGTNNSAPIVISCIYWRERNDYFITSVDCIYLLESLIGIQFTVEEKNRIRRNLEGFRPLTVSKCKAECADFFKLIMSFPHPKPRNIEKDVKVFSWKTLPHALRKIIRKYTPSYIASTPLEPIHPQQQQQQTSNSASSSASHLHHTHINKF